MTIQTTYDDTAAMFSPSGWLDALSAPQFARALQELPAEITDLVIDCAQLEYVSSAGLRQLALAQKKMEPRGSFTLIHVSEAIMDLFRMTGLVERLSIL